MKFNPEEKAITFRIAAYAGLALVAFMGSLMVFATEEQWRMNGPIYMLLGVLGYFSLVFLGMVAFLKMEIRGAGGKLRRLTVWEVLGFCAMGVVMSKLMPYIDSRIGSGPLSTVAAVLVLAGIALLLVLQHRKSKAL